MIVRQYEVNLGISSYELDFFGRIRSLKDQAWSSTSPPNRRAAACRSAWWPKLLPSI